MTKIASAPPMMKTAAMTVRNLGYPEGVAVLIGAGIQIGATLGYDGAHVNIVAPNGNYVGPTVPWAWAPGHTILLRGTYESA